MNRGTAATVPEGAGSTRRRPARAATPPEDATPLDWGQIAVFAGGLALGLAAGAGAALLFAPRSGAGTRHALVRQGRRLGQRAHDAWDDARDDLWRASRRGRRRLQRRLREAWLSRGDED